MSETDTNKQDDTDVLRAEDIQEASEPRPSDGRGEIPKFDLAEQILAEQRKITAIRRKAPGKKPQRLPSLAPSLLSATPVPAVTQRVQAADKGVTRVQPQDGAAGEKTESRPSDGRGEPPAREREVEPIGYTINPARQKTGGIKLPPLTLSEQGRIIAEIVARDIEK
ncbi:unnamed protein product, partial [marine sediment metagenome]